MTQESHNVSPENQMPSSDNVENSSSQIVIRLQILEFHRQSSAFLKASDKDYEDNQYVIDNAVVAPKLLSSNGEFR